MPQLSFTLYSQALLSNTRVIVILPIWNEYDSYISSEDHFQVLWLLHGGTGSYTDWTEKTNINWLSQKHRFAVVIPDTGTNHYNDVPGGPKYFTYLTEELPALLGKYLPLSSRREDNFIAGLSMGGFGAAKCAFCYPEKYGAAGFFSTGPQNGLQLRHSGMGMETPGYDRYDRIFGGKDKIPNSINDPWYILKKAVNAGKELPLIYNCCGTEDPAYPSFRAFEEYAASLGVKTVSHEAFGWHAWDYWNLELERFIDWLPLLKTRDYLEHLQRQIGGIIVPQKTAELPEKIEQLKNIYFEHALPDSP